MAFLPQVKVPAVYMRGGTSKGVFFRLQDLPEAAQVPGAARDALLMRVIGSPDPYGKQTDGMGGATSSTSKCVIISTASVPDHDVDYLYGQVSIDTALVDCSGNCGNLSAAVGPFAIQGGLIDAATLPRDGIATVRIWQANIGKTIIAHVPMRDGEVQETGDFELDGVTFPAAEVELTFVDPGDDDGDAGEAAARCSRPGTWSTSCICPRSCGTELQDAINGDPAALKRLEAIRAHAALHMGLIKTLEEARVRQHTPKLAFVAPAASYRASSGKTVEAGGIDVLVRALSMGKLHHAMMGTAAVAIGTAAAIPGTLVCEAAGGKALPAVRFGHPSGTLRVGAEAVEEGGQWRVTRAVMSRSARILMEGAVRVPAEFIFGRDNHDIDPQDPAQVVNERRGVLVPGAFNALSAKVIEDLGFEALYVTGAGVTNMWFGLPDQGFMGLAEIADHTARIRDAVELPLIVDADTGFGNALNVRHTVRVLERAGADCIQFEDQVAPKRCGHFSGKDVISTEEAVSKIKAAVDARTDPDLLVMARTDAAATLGFEAAIERAQQFAEAGAESSPVHAAADEHGHRRQDPDHRRERAAADGLRVVLYANAALQGAVAGMQKALGVLKTNKRIDEDPALVVPFAERQRLVGKPEWDALEKKYT
ncbi:prpF protein [Ditylenchus destructor]|nr:prpF protein [Ditylenchus destructor]